MGKKVRIIEKEDKDAFEVLEDEIINQAINGRIDLEPDNKTWTMFDDKGREIGSTKSWQVKEKEAADRISLEKGTAYHHPDGRIFDNGTGIAEEDVPVDFVYEPEEENQITIQLPNTEMKELFHKKLEIDRLDRQIRENKEKMKLLEEQNDD